MMILGNEMQKFLIFLRNFPKTRHFQQIFPTPLAFYQQLHPRPGLLQPSFLLF